MPVTGNELSSGSLVKPSWIRTDKLFTLERSLVRKRIAQLDAPTLGRVRHLVTSLVQGKEP